MEVGGSFQGYSRGRAEDFLLQVSNASVDVIGGSGGVREMESSRLDPGVIDAGSTVGNHQRQGECCHVQNRTQEVGLVSRRLALSPIS